MSRLGPLIFLAILVAVTSGLGQARGRDEDLFIRPEDEHTVLFGSLDAGRSVFASGGAKQTFVGPLDRTGFVAMETTGFGLTQERFKSDGINLPAQRLVQQASVLGGYQWNLGPVFASGFVGLEAHREQLLVAGRIYRHAQPRFGVRGQVEIWAHPTPGTLFTATVVSGSTRTSVWGRVSAGLEVAPGTYVGPEATTYVTPTYRETRWGAHVTGVPLGRLQVRLSAGWMTDDAHAKGSPYGGVTAWIRL